MHNETGGNIPDYEANMERAMKRYAELGIHTLKTGYAGGFRDGYSHHSQYGVQHYQRVVETRGEVPHHARRPRTDQGDRHPPHMAQHDDP